MTSQPDEASPFADAVLRAAADGDAVVPSVWPYEVANMFVMAERRNRISAEDVTLALAAMRTLSVEVRQPHATRALPALMLVARDHGLSACDAAYLELAIRTRSRLATLDTVLERAAVQAGVPLFSA